VNTIVDIVIVYKFDSFTIYIDVLPVIARGSAVFHGGQLHVDVLRRTALAHGSGRGVRQRRERDALVLRHRLGRTCRAHRPVRVLEEQFRGHRSVSAPIKSIANYCLRRFSNNHYAI